MLTAQEIRDKQTKIHKVNEEEINKKVNEQLSILESIIDKTIQKDNQTCITIKLDLHTRTIKKLEELGYLVSFNNATDEFAISWDWQHTKGNDTQDERVVDKDDLNNNPYKYNIPKYERPKMYKCEGGKEDKIYYSPIDKELVDEILKLMSFER